MSKEQFLANMMLAYLQNHGSAPTDHQLDNWSELYVALESKGGQ